MSCNIDQRINLFVSRRNGVCKQDVTVKYAGISGAISNINYALVNATNDEKLELSVDLMQLWISKEVSRENMTMFKDILDECHGCVFMFTLTEDSRQLRVWYGVPAIIQAGNVASNGHGLLFEVIGEPELVMQHLLKLLDIYPLTRCELINGAMIFLRLA